MKHLQKFSFENLSLIQKRAAILLGFRWRDTSHLDKVLMEMDKIRLRLSAKIGKRHNGTSIIRRFRDSR